MLLLEMKLSVFRPCIHRFYHRDKSEKILFELVENSKQNFSKFIVNFSCSLISKIEKNLSDHTEFMNVKDEFEEWINKARGNIQDCIGDGDLPWIDDKLLIVKNVSEKMTEGFILFLFGFLVYYIPIEMKSYLIH